MATATAPVDRIRTVFPFPRNVDSVVVTGVAKTVTVPSGTFFALIKPSDVIYIRFGGTAAVPAGDTTDGSASFLINSQNGSEEFNVRGIASFSIIGTAVVTIAWYSDPSAP